MVSRFGLAVCRQQVAMAATKSEYMHQQHKVENTRTRIKQRMVVQQLCNVQAQFRVLLVVS